MVLNPTNPFPPAWSPNHQYPATTKVGQRFVTPEGGNYKLFLNGKILYPTKVAHGLLSVYKDQHTFLSELEWPPYSRHVAFIEKIYDWEYYDPYNRYWHGWASTMRYYLAVVSTDGTAKGYPLSEAPQSLSLEWLGGEASSITSTRSILQLIRGSRSNQGYCKPSSCEQKQPASTHYGPRHHYGPSRH